MSLTALDSSSLIAYLEGHDRADTRLVHDALIAANATLPPVVVTEVLSQHRLPPALSALIRSVTMLELTAGYWDERVRCARACLLDAEGRASPRHSSRNPVSTMTCRS